MIREIERWAVLPILLVGNPNFGNLTQIRECV